MSKIYLVQGEHWSVPGQPMTAHASKEAADAEAKKLVAIMVGDMGGWDALDIDPDASWQDALRMVQTRRVKEVGDEEVLSAIEKGEHPWGYVSTEVALAEVAECDVWITELNLQNPLEELYEQLAKMGRLWLELLIKRQDIDPEETAIRFTANMGNGSSREVAKVTLAEALGKFDAAGIDVTKELEGLA